MSTVQRPFKLSADVVAALLAGKNHHEAELARLCAEEREILARDAAVTAFLEIFVVRNVQQRLRALMLADKAVQGRAARTSDQPLVGPAVTAAAKPAAAAVHQDLEGGAARVRSP